jgi:hypothetical protein
MSGGAPRSARSRVSDRSGLPVFPRSPRGPGFPVFPVRPRPLRLLCGITVSSTWVTSTYPMHLGERRSPLEVVLCASTGYPVAGTRRQSALQRSSRFLSIGCVRRDLSRLSCLVLPSPRLCLCVPEGLTDRVSPARPALHVGPSFHACLGAPEHPSIHERRWDPFGHSERRSAASVSSPSEPPGKGAHSGTELVAEAIVSVVDDEQQLLDHVQSGFYVILRTY